MSVPSILRVTYFLVRSDPTRFHRRRGFSNRATTVVFVVTVINFFLFSLNTGTVVAAFIDKTLTLDTEYPLSRKRESVNHALQNLNIVDIWSANLPVSSDLSVLDSVSVDAR